MSAREWLTQKSARRWAQTLTVALVLVLCQQPGISQAPAELTREQENAALREINGYMRSFVGVLEMVQENYAEKPNLDKAIYEGAIPEMLHTLDPHSNFFDPKSTSAFREEEHGKYFGVGMTIAPRNNHIIVLAPFVGTPAYRAGIRPGDVIVAVNDKSTDSLNASDVADMLKGPKGTTVKITIARPGIDKPLLFNVTRDEIPRDSVDLKFALRPGIGYIHVAQFNENTGREVAQALSELGNLQGLVFDLRGNPGGRFDQAVDVADQFLRPGQLIVSQKGRSMPPYSFTVPAGRTAAQYPLVVLVNRGSASASEIVSGAIQDHDRGLIAGETTFGKGLVQLQYPLPQNTLLLLTVARYYTPSGRVIQRDYTGVSLYDYYYNNPDQEPPHTEVRHTDHGRTVYGGGGITPDIKIPTIKTTAFEDSLLQHYAFFNFAQQYLNGHTVDKNWQVTPAVMSDFTKFLAAQKIAFTEKDVEEGSDWIKLNIRTEIFVAQFGQQEGLRARAEGDPQVQSALKLMPKATELLRAGTLSEGQVASKK